jgi:hypothetical protein
VESSNPAEVKPKKKVFVDIGINRFDDYDQLIDPLKIDNDWVKIFIDPNPNFIKDASLVKKFHTIPNSHFINLRLGKTTVTLEKILEKYMDAEWWFKIDRTAVDVDLLTEFLEKHHSNLQVVVCSKEMKLQIQLKTPTTKYLDLPKTIN